MKCFQARSALIFPYTPFSLGMGREKQVFFVHGDAILDDIEFVKFNMPKFRSKIVEIGELYFTQFKSDQRFSTDARERICYIYSGMYNYNITYKIGEMEDASLYNLRYQVLQIAQSHECDFTYKFGYNIENVGCNVEKEIKESKHLKFIPSSISLSKIFDDFEYFILETPSTTLVELIAKNKKVICFVDQLSLSICPKIKDALEDACEVVYEKKRFLEIIQKLVNREYKIKKSNTTRFNNLFIGTKTMKESIEEFNSYIIHNHDEIVGRNKYNGK